MKTFKQSIIIDVDGTLYDNFSYDDRRIICKIFRDSPLVKTIDKILWSINSLDYISNSMGILKFRLMLYSVISLKRYSFVINEYKYWYKEQLMLCLREKEELLEKLADKYEIIFVTNNLYALRVLYHDFHTLYTPNCLNRKEQVFCLNTDNDIAYIVGNNYMDDILIARKNNIPSIYVGNSIFKKKYKPDFCISTFDEILKVLEIKKKV